MGWPGDDGDDLVSQADVRARVRRAATQAIRDASLREIVTYLIISL
jgi:hypothetical protein